MLKLIKFICWISIVLYLQNLIRNILTHDLYWYFNKYIIRYTENIISKSDVITVVPYLISIFIASIILYLLQKIIPGNKNKEVVVEKNNDIQSKENLEMNSKSETSDTNKKPDQNHLSSSEKFDDAKKIAVKASEKFSNYEKKLLDEKSDYPVIQLLGKIFNVLAMLNALVGVLFALGMLIDLNIGMAIICLLLGAFSYLICKFISETTKIIADIATYLKTIRNNTNFLKK